MVKGAGKAFDNLVSVQKLRTNTMAPMKRVVPMVVLVNFLIVSKIGPQSLNNCLLNVLGFRKCVPLLFESKRSERIHPPSCLRAEALARKRQVATAARPSSLPLIQRSTLKPWKNGKRVSSEALSPTLHSFGDGAAKEDRVRGGCRKTPMAPGSKAVELR